jgi:hypothetical protein
VARDETRPLTEAEEDAVKCATSDFREILEQCVREIISEVSAERAVRVVSVVFLDKITAIKNGQDD